MLFFSDDRKRTCSQRGNDGGTKGYVFLRTIGAFSKAKVEKKKNSGQTSLGVPKRSPIQVLTEPNIP